MLNYSRVPCKPSIGIQLFMCQKNCIERSLISPNINKSQESFQIKLPYKCKVYINSRELVFMHNVLTMEYQFISFYSKQKERTQQQNHSKNQQSFNKIDGVRINEKKDSFMEKCLIFIKILFMVQLLYFYGVWKVLPQQRTIFNHEISSSCKIKQQYIKFDLKLRMGGQHSNLGMESFKKADWTQVALKEKGAILWSHRRDDKIKLVSYPIFSQSQKQYKHEKDLYWLRKNNPILVSAFALQSFENQDFCSTQYKQTLFLEHIPITLSDIEHIPYPDHLHIYEQAFKGFQVLANSVGCFIVEEEHIGINEKGVVKVWLNGEFHRSFIVGCRVVEEIMVRSIVETIDKSSDEITLPRGIPTVKNYLFRNNGSLNFKIILSEFNEYLNLYNGGKVPDRLACIDKVGIHTIVDRDTHAWEGQDSLLDFDRQDVYQQQISHQSRVNSQKMYPSESFYRNGIIPNKNLLNFERKLSEKAFIKEIRSSQNIKIYGSPEKTNVVIPLFHQYSQLNRPSPRPELVLQTMNIHRKPEILQSQPSNNVPLIRIPPPSQIKSPTLTTVKSSQHLKASHFMQNPPLITAQSSPVQTPIRFIQNLISPNKPIVENHRPLVTFQSPQVLLKNSQSPTGMKHSHILQKIHFPPQSHPHYITQKTSSPQQNTMPRSHLISFAQPAHQPINSIYTSPPGHKNHQVRTVPITVEVVPGKVQSVEKIGSQTSKSQMMTPQKLQRSIRQIKKKGSSMKKIHTNVPAFISKHRKTASNLKQEETESKQQVRKVEKQVDITIVPTAHENMENTLAEQPLQKLRQVIYIPQQHQQNKQQVVKIENHQIIEHPVDKQVLSIKQPQQVQVAFEENKQQENITDPFQRVSNNEQAHVLSTENLRQIDQHEPSQQQESSLINNEELKFERLTSQQINRTHEQFIHRPISDPNDNRAPLNSEYLEPHLKSQLQSVQNHRMQSNINSEVQQGDKIEENYHIELENNRQFIHQKEEYSQIVENPYNDGQTYPIYQPKMVQEVQKVEKYDQSDRSIAEHNMASIPAEQKDDKYSLWTAGYRDYVSASLPIEPVKETLASFNPNYTNKMYEKKSEIGDSESDNYYNYNPFGENDVVYSSYETATIPNLESYQEKGQRNDKLAKVANIHIDDGKSSQDFLRRLREMGSGLSSADRLQSTQQGHLNSYSAKYINFKRGSDEDYGTSYLKNYVSSQYNIQDYRIPSYPQQFAQKAHEYQGRKHIQACVLESKYYNTFQPKSSFSDDDFGKNAVSKIIPTGLASGQSSISYGEPLKFENNIALVLSRTEEVSPTQSPNGPSSYRARYDPQILADLNSMY